MVDVAAHAEFLDGNTAPGDLLTAQLGIAVGVFVFLKSESAALVNIQERGNRERCCLKGRTASVPPCKVMHPCPCPAHV